MNTSPRIAVSSHDHAVVVSPVGEFDIASVDLLRSTLLDAVGPDSNRIVLDLGATTFVDSMVLGVLIGTSRRAQGWGGWVRLVAPQPNVRNVLRITGLDRAFGLYDTVEQAVGAATEHDPATGPTTGPATDRAAVPG